MSIRQLITGTLFMASAVIRQDAAVILSDSFDYPDGVLQSVSSQRWAGHSGTENEADVANGQLVLTGAESEDVSASLDGQPYGVDGDPFLYCGFTVRFVEPPSGRGSYFAHFKNGRSGFRARIWAKLQDQESGVFRLGISSSSGSAPSAMHETDLSLDTEYRVVCRLSVPDAVATLWVDPETEQSASVSSDSGSDIEVVAIAFRQASGIGTLMIRDLLVGTAFEDVARETARAAEAELPAIKTDSPVPAILTQPESLSVLANSEVSFRVVAGGEEPLEYQWRFNDSEIAGATDPMLILSVVGAEQQGDYRVVVKNEKGTATSAAATLTIVETPTITEAPPNLTVKAGQDIVLSVAVRGTEPFVYQWSLNGKEIEGASSETLLLSEVSIDQAGEYRVTVRNLGGEATSEPAVLTIAVPRPPEIEFSNSLKNLRRPGDMPINTFSEVALMPGEELLIHATVSDPKGETAAVRVNTEDLPASAGWELLDPGEADWSGEFGFLPSEEDEGSAFRVWLESANSDGASRVEWKLYVPTKEEQGIVVNEILANPTTSADAPHFNPLNRAEPAPNPSSNDEFVELRNASDTAIDLRDWTISDSVTIRHRFGEIILQPYDALVVYGGPQEGAVPDIAARAIPASATVAGLALNNSGGDMIVLRNANGDLIRRIVYTSLPTDSSLTRYPDPDSDFVAQSEVGSLLVSPGVMFDGSAFEAPILAPSVPEAFQVEAVFDGALLLKWTAEPLRVYTVREAVRVDGPFVPLVDNLTFADGEGSYTDDRPIESMRFYRVSTPQ